MDSVSTSFWSYSQWSRFFPPTQKREGQIESSSVFWWFYNSSSESSWCSSVVPQQKNGILGFLFRSSLLSTKKINEERKCCDANRNPVSLFINQAKWWPHSSKNVQKPKNLFGPNSFLIPTKIETAPTFWKYKLWHWPFYYGFFKKFKFLTLHWN